MADFSRQLAQARGRIRASGRRTRPTIRGALGAGLGLGLAKGVEQEQRLEQEKELLGERERLIRERPERPARPGGRRDTSRQDFWLDLFRRVEAQNKGKIDADNVSETDALFNKLAPKFGYEPFAETEERPTPEPPAERGVVRKFFEPRTPKEIKRSAIGLLSPVVGPAVLPGVIGGLVAGMKQPQISPQEIQDLRKMHPADTAGLSDEQIIEKFTSLQ